MGQRRGSSTFSGSQYGKEIIKLKYQSNITALSRGDLRSFMVEMVFAPTATRPEVA